jgi:hypothetical protein
MENPVVEIYKKEKAKKQKWLEENKELEETTLYQTVLLGVAVYDVGIAMAKAIGEAVERANNAFTR